MRYYKICVDNTKGLFTYADKNDEYIIGQRVEIFFRNKKRTGVIISEDREENINFKVLNIQNKVDNSIELDANYMKLLKWIAKYYMSSFDQVLNAAIPSGLSIQYEKYYKILNSKEIFTLDVLTEKELSYIDGKLRVTKATLVKNFNKELVEKMLDDDFLVKRGNYLYLKDYNLEIKEYKKILLYYEDRKKIRDISFEKNISKKSINLLLKNNYISFGKEFLKQNKIEVEETVVIWSAGESKRR